jgi:sulfide:quinone oxidoreductase
MALKSDSPSPVRVAIIGGGVAALEAMLALNRLSYSGADVHLFSPRDRFVLKPLAVSSGFGRGDLLSFDLSRLAGSARATFRNLGVSEVDAPGQKIRLADGSWFEYDYLIAAQGTESSEAVPGATTYRWSAGNEAVRAELAGLRDKEQARVVVTAPEGAAWPLPTYELALLISEELGEGASVSIVTPEEMPLGLFGAADSAKVAELLKEQNVETILGSAPAECRDGALVTSDGRRVEADLVLALPRLSGRRIPGLPCDSNGFIPVDEFGRIHDHTREFAAGDVTSFPVKFGGLAAAQADIVATAIAADAWGGLPPQPFKPVYRALLVTAGGLVGLGPGVEDHGAHGRDPAEKVYGRYLMPFLKAADAATTSD